MRLAFNPGLQWVQAMPGPRLGLWLRGLALFCAAVGLAGADMLAFAGA